jgi:hypothetical protein
MAFVSFGPFSDSVRDLSLFLLKFHVFDDSLSHLASVKVFEQLIVFLNFFKDGYFGLILLLIKFRNFLLIFLLMLLNYLFIY